MSLASLRQAHGYQMNELWIIEASGKKESLEKALSRLERNAKVCATLGHIMHYPDDLSEVGIAADFSEPLRIPRDNDIIDYIIKLAFEAEEQIIIATDADQEGDVIAWDVHEILRSAGVKLPIIRVGLRVVDPDAIEEALSISYEVTPADAAPGRARAMVDRLLSATFSTSRAPVGRVTSALLGRLAEKAVSLRKYVIVVPADDGGMPFRTEVVPENRHQDEVLRKVVSAKLVGIPAADPIYYQYSAENMGDLIVSMSDKAKTFGQRRTVRELGDSMQRLYERGVMSYPRSGTRGYGPSAMKRIDKSLRSLPSRPAANPNIRIKEHQRTHDAPHPVGDVSFNDSQHGFLSDNSVRVAVAQSVARAAHMWPGEVPDKSALQSAFMDAGIAHSDARWLSELPWVRWDGVLPPGAQAHIQSHAIPRSPDAALILLQMEEEIGKPSTWINRADKFIHQNGGLVAPSEDGMALVLTELGRRALSAAPDFMRNPEFSRQIERLCNTEKGTGPYPWREIVAKVLSAQPKEIREAMEAKLAPVEPQKIFIKIPKPSHAPRPDFDD